ncbi:hypothetical protein [Arvimicrobium flavum]|uniref:hypothetical protein n=1 Tax=Arvimicrobium flavum TaxID=3393320 RepID=UPI00237C3222|nr:hypothetical protein [Mesorhizobium shangrilense]
MLEQIIELLNANLVRVENLTSRYGPPRPGRKALNDTDMLRAALVLLHASMEEFLRSLLIWRAPSSAKEVIDTFPLAGTGKKHPANFQLGSLVAHRGKTVEELIRQSATEYLEAYSSFNDVGDVVKAIRTCGVPQQTVEAHDFRGLAAMIERRHNIVHKADRNNVQQGQGNHRTKSIDIGHLNNYVAAVKSLRDFVNAQLANAGQGAAN